MAIYHFSGTVLSRSQGRSSIAAAAYRSGEKLYDERQERTLDYTRKQDVIFKEVLLPPNAPDWMRDREKLWNAVEKAENRKDAQLAREINFSLPRELSKGQNIELATEFVKNEFVSKGMIADLCIHAGKNKNGEEQPHAHIMLTLREVNKDGFGLKERSWNAKENFMLWREEWAEYANKYLALNGIDQKIDHRSFADQGIDLISQTRLAQKNTKDYERSVALYQRIARENGERILADPNIALNAITHRQSTFTQHDLVRFINRHTVDAEQFQGVYATVKGSDQIVSLGKDAHNIERFTIKEMIVLEQKMMKGVSSLENKGHELKHVFLELRAAANANQRKSGITESDITKLSSQQKDALEHITSSGDIKCLIGYAGTGKSHILKEAREIWEKNGYRVHGATLSGIAAENLEGASGIDSRTFASRCYYWDSGRQLLTEKDILVIDEAGMLGTRQMARVVDEAITRGFKLVLIGDPQQLQAIEAGAAFRAIVTKTGYLELTEVRRQLDPWQQAATKEFALGDVKSALDRYDRYDHIHSFETQDLAKTSLVEMWNDVRISQPDKTQIMLAYTRKDVKELNEIARDCRKQNDELGEDHELQTSAGVKSFAEGDRIYFLRNNRDLGVMNGTLGSLERIVDNKLTIALDRDYFKSNEIGAGRQIVNLDLDYYNYISHGYAATIHKFQGGTVDRSYILLSKHLDSHAAYVGTTRHRESADLFWSKEEFNDYQTLSYILSRDRSKDVALDYIQDPDKEYGMGVELIEKIEKIEKTEKIEKDDLQNEYNLGLREQDHFDETISKEERVSKIYEQYQELKHEYLDARKEVIKMFDDGCIESEIDEQRKIRDEAKETLDRYSNEIYKDKDVMDYLEKNDTKEFNEMNERFNELMRGQMHEMQDELERSL